MRFQMRCVAPPGSLRLQPNKSLPAFVALGWLARVVLLVLVALAAVSCDSTSVHKQPTPIPTATPPCGANAYKQANPVAAENTCPGTTSWRVDHSFGPSNAIEAFTAPASVNAGGTVSLYVTTTAASYMFAVYRLGYYQGQGARLMYSSSSIPGIAQPAPTIDPTTRMVSCDNWRNPVQINVPVSWVSGVYIVKLSSASGYIRYTLFVVRSDASASPILVQIPLLTYQAYNPWGGYSLYLGRDAQGVFTFATRAYVVSFDRPYFRQGGLMQLPLYDYDLLFWLEEQGYNVSYQADIDANSPIHPLSNRRLLIFSGHTEYWSTAMRNNVTAARDAGTSLAFFGANNIYWHVRLQDSPLGSEREETCYKDASLDSLAATDPSATTVRWREAPLNDPENSLLGQMYHDPVQGSESLVIGNGAQPFLANTTLHVGSSLPGLLGGEFDRVANNGQEPAGVSSITVSPVKCLDPQVCPPNGADISTATLYVAASGAKVFDAGTFQWSWGLHDDTIDPALPQHAYSNANFQTLTANILQYLLQK